MADGIHPRGGGRVPSHRSDQHDYDPHDPRGRRRSHSRADEDVEDRSRHNGHPNRRRPNESRGYRTERGPPPPLASRWDHRRDHRGGGGETAAGNGSSRSSRPREEEDRRYHDSRRQRERSRSYPSTDDAPGERDRQHPARPDRYPRPPLNSGNGRGRGRGLLKPSWMTDEQYREQQQQQQQAGPVGDHSLPRERAVSGQYSDTEDERYRGDARNREDTRRYDSSRREGDSRRSFDRRDHRRRHSRDYTSGGSDRDNDDYDDNETRGGRKSNNKRKEKDAAARENEPKEWPPCFQKDGSAFTFDVRSAMFYEPKSDFFYDPKSKLYYGNKKHAYFRYDDTEKPPFVEVQKMTTEQVAEQQRGETGGIAQEQVELFTSGAKAVGDQPEKPKIAFKFKTKKVKSSVSAAEAPKPTGGANGTLSKEKQQQIANIGKWNEKQAELKQGSCPTATATAEPSPKPKVRTTVKGEPICVLCKKKFPNLAKLRLHEKGSELHKTNLRKLREKKKQAAASGTKRKAEDAGKGAPAAATAAYTDRAEKRRQLHGVDLRAPSTMGLTSLLQRFEDSGPVEPSEPATTGSDLLSDEANVGRKLLEKMGYQNSEPTSDKGGKKPSTANEHLRQEWDRIEALAQKSGPRNR